MIKHILIEHSISTLGDILGLGGLEMYMKGDTTYLQHKGWVDLKTRKQVLDNYRYSYFTNSILIPILSEDSKPINEPSYEQQLMDKAALQVFNTLMLHKDFNNKPTKDLAQYAFEHAKEFILERKKQLL